MILLCEAVFHQSLIFSFGCGVDRLRITERSSWRDRCDEASIPRHRLSTTRTTREAAAQDFRQSMARLSSLPASERSFTAVQEMEAPCCFPAEAACPVVDKSNWLSNPFQKQDKPCEKKKQRQTLHGCLPLPYTKTKASKQRRALQIYCHIKFRFAALHKALKSAEAPEAAEK